MPSWDSAPATPGAELGLGVPRCQPSRAGRDVWPNSGESAIGLCAEELPYLSEGSLLKMRLIQPPFPLRSSRQAAKKVLPNTDDVPTICQVKVPSRLGTLTIPVEFCLTSSHARMQYEGVSGMSNQTSHNEALGKIPRRARVCSSRYRSRSSATGTLQRCQSRSLRQRGGGSIGQLVSRYPQG